MPLAVALKLAVPAVLMVAGLPLIVADAPFSGGVNLTRPPATGSLGFLAVTFTTSPVDGKAVSTPVDWPLPEVTAMLNPLDSNAPMSTTVLTMRGRPRWSVVMPEGTRELLPEPMAWLPGSKAMVCVGPP